MSGYRKRIAAAADALTTAALGVDPAEVDALAAALAQANRIVLSGVGREGLMMRALAMRLYHLGLDAHVAGDMTAPPLGPGDLLVVSAGPGEFLTLRALVDLAREAGAATAAITAQPAATIPGLSDTVLTIPAQTMANDTGRGAISVLPMGSVFEGAQFLVFECVVLALRDRLGVTSEAMRARHTNLE